MKQVILQEFVTLRFAETIDTILLGRVTGEGASRLDLTLQEARPFDRGEVALKYTRTGR